MSIERLLDGLEARSTSSQKAEDYIDPEDGLLHCAVCGKPKQTRLRWIDGQMKTVGVVCGCYEKEQAERREREQAERVAQVAALRHVRDHSDSTPEQKLEAVKLLLELEREGYSY